MSINLNSRIRHKKDTAANWTSANPVLYAGEIILVETNSGALRLKVGDGSKRYNQLPFADEELYNLLGDKASVSAIPTKLSELSDDIGLTSKSNLVEAEVEISTGNSSTINLPNTLTGIHGLVVYQNGIKLSKGSNYTVSSDNKSISLVGYTASNGDIFSFVSLQ